MTVVASTFMTEFWLYMYAYQVVKNGQNIEIECGLQVDVENIPCKKSCAQTHTHTHTHTLSDQVATILPGVNCKCKCTRVNMLTHCSSIYMRWYLCVCVCVCVGGWVGASVCATTL